VFKTYRAHHFHSVTHECYAVFRGRSELLLGRGPLDDDDERDGGEGRVVVGWREGDVIVLPVSFPFVCVVASEGLKGAERCWERRRGLVIVRLVPRGIMSILVYTLR